MFEMKTVSARVFAAICVVLVCGSTGLAGGYREIDGRGNNLAHDEPGRSHKESR